MRVGICSARRGKLWGRGLNRRNVPRIDRRVDHRYSYTVRVCWVTLGFHRRHSPAYSFTTLPPHDVRNLTISSLIAHRSSLVAHYSSLIAHCSSLVAHDLSETLTLNIPPNNPHVAFDLGATTAPWNTVAGTLIADTWRINNEDGTEPLYPYKGDVATRFWFEAP